MDTTSDLRRAIVDLLPQYLPRRRRGFRGTSELTVELPDYLLLRAIAAETDPGSSASADDLRANLFNPYSTVRPVLERLPNLVAAGLLDQQGDRYTVSEPGQRVVAREEAAATDYTAARLASAPADLERLSTTLTHVAERLWRAGEPNTKPHQARVQRLRRIDPRTSPPVLLEHAIYALWMARDDAHTAAWREAGFDGPTFELLSQLWAGSATTVAALIERTQHDQQPEDVERGVNELAQSGYIQRDGERLTITARGQQTRDEIERETDRVYFAPWPPIDAPWVRDQIQALIDGFG